MSSRLTKSHPGYKADNEFLSAIEARAKALLRQWAMDGVPFNHETFEAKLFHNSQSVSKKLTSKIKPFLDDIAERLDKEGKFASAKLRSATASKIESFTPGTLISDINQEWIERFDSFMVKTGSNDSTRKSYLTALKTACKEAARQGIMQRDWQPFVNAEIAPKSKNPTKRALSISMIRAIESYPCKGAIQEYRDVFMLSFYLRGINLIDLARIKLADIKNGRLKYTRTKTKQTLDVLVSTPARALIESLSRNEYLVPVLAHSPKKMSEKEVRHTIMKYGVRLNGAIKKICADLGIDSGPRPVTYYFARHTYATSLKRAGVDPAMISDLLGLGNLYSNTQSGSTKVRLGIYSTTAAVEKAKKEVVARGFTNAVVVMERADDPDIQEFILDAPTPLEKKNAKMQSSKGTEAAIKPQVYDAVAENKAKPYYIRIAALANPERFDGASLQDLGSIEKRKADNASGMTVILLGSYDTHDAADAVLTKVQRRGYAGAYILKDTNGKLVRE